MATTRQGDAVMGSTLVHRLTFVKQGPTGPITGSMYDQKTIPFRLLPEDVTRNLIAMLQMRIGRLLGPRWK
jgi:hypothetical protein